MLVRLLLPAVADQYRSEIEQLLSEQLQTTVSIGQLHLTWWGWGPVLQINDFSLSNSDTGAAIIDFKRAQASINVSRSLLNRRLLLRDLHFSGSRLIVQWSAEQGGHFLPQVTTTHNRADSIPISEVLHWLLSMQALNVSFDHLELRHSKNNKLIIAGHDLNLDLHGLDSGRQQLQAVLALDRDYHHHNPQTVSATIDLWESEQGSFEYADFYLYSKALALNSIAQPFVEKSIPGKTDIALWGQLKNDQFVDIVGELEIYAIAQQAPLFMGFEWQPDQADNNWQLRVQTQAEQDQYINRQSYFKLSASDDYLRGEIHHLHLQQWIPFITALSPALSEQAQQVINGLAPSGLLPQAVLQITPESGDYELAAQFEDVRIQRWQAVPGLNQLRGNIAFNASGGRLLLDSRSVQLDWQLLRAPIAVDRLLGGIKWHKTGTGLSLLLQSDGIHINNADLTAAAAGKVWLIDGQTPYLDLDLNYHDGDVAHAFRYLPTILHPKLMQWLDQALLSGSVDRGTMRFQGYAHEFPFDNGQGQFESHFWVDNMQFDYRTDWPLIEQLSAEVLFHNRSFNVVAERGRIFDVPLQKVQANIDDLENATLIIDGQAQGRGSSMMRFVQQSPLDEKIGRYLKQLRSKGDTILALNLNIPIEEKEKPVSVDGTLGLNGSTIILPEQKLELRRLRGDLLFDQDSLKASDLKLNFRGSPARLAIAMKGKPGQKDRQMHFRLRGQLDRNALLGPTADALQSQISGRSDWDVLLKVPLDDLAQNSEQNNNYQLELHSDLRGMAINLPAPLAKSRDSKKNIKLDVLIKPDKTLQLAIDYAKNTHASTHALLQLSDDNGEVRFDRGELRINSGIAQLPVESGLNIIARLAKYDALSNSTAGSDNGVDGHTLPDWFNQLQANIGELKVGDYVLSDTQIQLRRSSKQSEIKLNGQHINGELIIPDRPKINQPLQVSLKKLALNKKNKAVETTRTGRVTQQPQQWPPMQINIDQLQINNAPLGQLQLSATPHENGLRLDNVSLLSDWHQLTAAGDWRINSRQKSHTQLEATLYSQQPSKTLAVFSDAELGITAAQTSAELTLNWLGGYQDFEPKTLQGTVAFNIGKGQLLDVDPGVGRLVGLLNLSSLTRRLQLDFSDLFKTGLAFDSIAGRLEFNRGIAKVDNVTVAGPSAGILINGQMDLKDSRHDHIITVIPDAGLPLAIAGTLAGGPVVGAALLFAEKFLKSGIGTAVQYQYTVTGSWQQPEIEPIANEAGQNESGWANSR